MRLKLLIFLLMVAGFCLVYRELEAMDSKPAGSGLATATAELITAREKCMPFTLDTVIF